MKNTSKSLACVPIVLVIAVVVIAVAIFKTETDGNANPIKVSDSKFGDTVDLHIFGDEKKTKGLKYTVMLSPERFDGSLPPQLSVRATSIESVQRKVYVVGAELYSDAEKVPSSETTLSLDRPINGNDYQPTTIDLIGLQADRSYSLALYLFPRNADVNVDVVQKEMVGKEAFRVSFHK